MGLREGVVGDVDLLHVWRGCETRDFGGVEDHVFADVKTSTLVFGEEKRGT